MSHGMKWRTVGPGLDRLKVPGGFLYRSTAWGIDLAGREVVTGQGLAFVPGPKPRQKGKRRAAK